MLICSKCRAHLGYPSDNNRHDPKCPLFAAEKAADGDVREALEARAAELEIKVTANMKDATIAAKIKEAEEAIAAEKAAGTE